MSWTTVLGTVGVLDDRLRADGMREIKSRGRPVWQRFSGRGFGGRLLAFRGTTTEHTDDTEGEEGGMGGGDRTRRGKRTRARCTPSTPGLARTGEKFAEPGSLSSE